MTIFVALMFQVLFVLFAMSINVGLVVYDKVNLQNSVDLAAYYGAQKQAETLNVIAHQNYQIRQAWKLLSWRYRVLGQFGLGKGENQVSNYRHPAYGSASQYTNEEIFQSGLRGSPEQREYPVVCIGYPGPWRPSFSGSNICKRRDFSIRSIVATAQRQNYGIYTRPSSIAVLQNIAQGETEIERSCGQAVAYSYLYAAGIAIAFRLEQKARKDIMYSLFYNMKGVGGDYVDLDGNSVKEGVQKMVNKNLTFGNTDPTLDFEPQIEYYNSVKQTDGGADQFFSDMKVEPILLYVDATSSGSRVCQLQPNVMGTLPNNEIGSQYISQLDGQSNGWISNFAARTERSNPYQYSLGLEKNPWSWVYTGVRATVKTRPLFFPFGEPLTMSAVAFAKPFGGRIGPWYKSNWNRGDNGSTGSLVDSLVPYKPEEVNIGSNGEISNYDYRFFPNYSRFPGDPFGLRSKLSLAAMSNVKNISGGISPVDHINVALEFAQNNDSVVWDRQNNNPDHMPRKIEIAAIAPDLFDATYYSVDPAFSKYYLPKLTQNKDKILKPGPKVSSINSIKIVGDLGSRGTNYVDAADQITKYNRVEKAQEAYYFLKEPQHLLTAWLHGKKYLDFSDNNYREKFAKCENWDESFSGSDPIPGICKLNGGRVGYSVKLISANLLYNKELKLGGENAEEGPILNPPKSFFEP